MNGAHDMGGMHGFGPVVAEPNEPVFHADWERRVLALNLAMGAYGRWNIDMSRFAREQMPPAEYLSTGYYEKWLYGLQKLLVEKGFVQPAELDSGPADRAALRPEALRKDQVQAALTRRRAARLDDPVPPQFTPGQRVRAKNINPTGHTRLPRYVRGHEGVIDRDHGVFVFPDTNAINGDKKPQHVYSVMFTAQELWGPDAPHSDSVVVDLWDDYLSPATPT